MNENSFDPASVYNKDYYDHYGSTSGVPYDRDQPVWQKHFDTFAKTLIERYKPRTTLDVGCAKGFLVEHLRDQGVEAFGVDVSPYAISQVREDIRPHCRVAKGNEPLSGQYDLITCIEVAEHVPEAEARIMVEEMCRHTDQVIFSSTDDGFDEPTHINIHPKEYWVELFQQQGFSRDLNFQPEFVTGQAMRFLRNTKSTLQVGVFSHEPPNCAVALLRLAGTIRYLEQQNRMKLQWTTARDPQIDIEKVLNCDIFTLHREFCDHHFSPQIVATARELGKPIVFELDDLLINVPKTNPNHKYCASITPDVLAMLREADFITVTTEPLRRYLEEAEDQAKGKVFVLPNFINLDIWDADKPPPEKPEDPFVIGWFGTATHDEDLAIIKPAIVEIARKYAGKVVFKFWGYLPEDLKDIPGVKLMRGSQPDLRLHARDVVNSRIDLAIAPLLDHPFNHAKSDLKWLEYSICYIPGLYSTISPYTLAVEHGRTGWLLDNKPELWVEAMERFINDHELRRTIAIQAHDEVRKKRCVNTGAEQWDALYRSFYVSGPKPKPAEAAATTPQTRATAWLMQYSANAFANKGDNVQALKTAELAIATCMPPSSSEGKLVGDVLRHYRNALVKLKETAELTASLGAAKSIADSGHQQAAVALYQQTLKLALQSKNPHTVLHIILNVAKAFQTLDPEGGRKVLDIGAQLAKSINFQPGQQAIEQLRKEYSQKLPAAPAKPTKNAAEPVKFAKLTSSNNGSSPAVSVIIPVFNNLTLTQSCLETLASVPANVAHEIIVVDNASTDGAPAYLKSLEKNGSLRVVTNSSNLGFAHACNQGAQNAKGSLLLFLNNDTRVTDGWLKALVKAGEKPNVGVVGAKLLYADGTIQHAGIEFINGIPDHPHRHAPTDLPAANKSRDLDMVTGACLLTPRNLFMSLGGFDETYHNGVEDVDYCLRVRALGKKVVYEPQSVVYHLEGQSAGRFNHVNENLKIFFGRWKGSFDQNFRFIAPQNPKIIAASQSILLNALIVSWEGSFLDYGSLSHVNRELVTALKGSPNLKIHCVNSGGPAVGDAEKIRSEFQISTQPVSNVAVTVRHAWPPNWRRPATGKLAVIQPWEFGSLPQEWVDRARDVDEFWVPSNYVRDVYISSGIPAQKIVVIPNGVDTEKFKPQSTPMKLDTQKKFKFLFVGGTIGRKGPDLLLQAYLKNFTDKDDVCLVIKDFGGKSVYAGQTFEAQIRTAQSAPNAPEILYLNDELPPDSLPGLYTACNCLVLPYRGEGFGLPVLEAMACGLPVIVTAGGSTDDFARDEFAWRILAARKIFGREVSGMKLTGDGWLLEPDLAALGEKMREAYAHPDKSRERGQLASTYAQENGSWKKSAALVIERLQKLASGQSPRPAPSTKPATYKLSPVAQIGQLNEARELFGQKKLEAAWNSTLAAIALRPFHPEGFLLLAEIAAIAGDSNTARQCAQIARDLAPGFTPVKQFLNKPLKGSAKLEWLKLPAINDQPSAINNLSVCLIVKNEEKFLPQCLKSVRAIAKQIVVVDTGSTDRTIAIAKEFGAEVHTHTWNDDFSAVRNVALEHATGDWILMLDADEEFPAAQHAKLLADMKSSSIIAYRLPLVNSGLESEGRSFVPRLFRNVPGAHYIGRIHEQVFNSLLPLCKSWGLKVEMGTAEILHHGYDKEMVRDRNKIERNLKLLHLAHEENPADVNLTMNLGLELVRSENLADGIAKYREAFQLMSEMPSNNVAPELREVLLTQFTSQLYKIREHGEVVQILTSPLAKSSGLTASLHLALGLSQFELKNYHEAADQMRQCLAKRKQPALSPINTDILTSMPNHCLALALVKINDAAGAEKAFEAALKENGLTESVKTDYAKFLTATNRPVEALQKMHELVATNCNSSNLWRIGGEIALSRPELLEFAGKWTGEAMRYVANDPAVAAQRAEALMLSGNIAAASELWEKIYNTRQEPRSLAALILCDTIESQTTHAPEEGQEEAAVSREFIIWYQRLIAMRSKAVLSRLNEQMDKLSRALPTAAKKIEAALTQSQKRETVA